MASEEYPLGRYIQERLQGLQATIKDGNASILRTQLVDERFLDEDYADVNKSFWLAYKEVRQSLLMQPDFKESYTVLVGDDFTATREKFYADKLQHYKGLTIDDEDLALQHEQDFFASAYMAEKILFQLILISDYFFDDNNALKKDFLPTDAATFYQDIAAGMQILEQEGEPRLYFKERFMRAMQSAFLSVADEENFITSFMKKEKTNPAFFDMQMLTHTGKVRNDILSKTPAFYLARAINSAVSKGAIKSSEKYALCHTISQQRSIMDALSQADETTRDLLVLLAITKEKEILDDDKCDYSLTRVLKSMDNQMTEQEIEYLLTNVRPALKASSQTHAFDFFGSASADLSKCLLVKLDAFIVGQVIAALKAKIDVTVFITKCEESKNYLQSEAQTLEPDPDVDRQFAVFIDNLEADKELLEGQVKGLLVCCGINDGDLLHRQIANTFLEDGLVHYKAAETLYRECAKPPVVSLKLKDLEDMDGKGEPTKSEEKEAESFFKSFNPFRR